MTDQLTQENRQQIAELVKQDSVLKGSFIDTLLTKLTTLDSVYINSSPIEEGDEQLGELNDFEFAICGLTADYNITLKQLIEEAQGLEPGSTEQEVVTDKISSP